MEVVDTSRRLIVLFRRDQEEGKETRNPTMIKNLFSDSHQPKFEK